MAPVSSTIKPLRFSVDEMDTTLPSGAYLDYWLRQDSTIMISWGTPAAGKIGAICSEGYGAYSPHFLKWEFENYIGVRHSCGSSCWSLVLLPKTQHDSITILQEDLCADTNRGYIFARRCFQEQSEFCLYNVNSRKHLPVNLPGYEWPGDITIALDSFAFVEEGLFVRWNSWKEDGGGIGQRDTVIALGSKP